MILSHRNWPFALQRVCMECASHGYTVCLCLYRCYICTAVNWLFTMACWGLLQIGSSKSSPEIIKRMKLRLLYPHRLTMALNRHGGGRSGRFTGDWSLVWSRVSGPWAFILPSWLCLFCLLVLHSVTWLGGEECWPPVLEHVTPHPSKEWRTMFPCI